MLTAELIRRKRDGAELSPPELEELVGGIADGTVTDAQVGAPAMAIFWRGMSPAERVALTGGRHRAGGHRGSVHGVDAGRDGAVALQAEAPRQLAARVVTLGQTIEGIAEVVSRRPAEGARSRASTCALTTSSRSTRR